MSNPYTAPSLSGYNATPPSNDGSATASNQLDWQKHIDKIGDPLKNYIQALSGNVLTAFGLEFGAAVLTKSTDYTVTTADRGRFISASSAIQITLPAAASAGSGFPLLVVNNGTDNVTVDGNGSETINGSANLLLYPGDGAVISCNGSAWFGALCSGRSTGTFTANWSGFATSESTTVRYSKIGNHVTLQFPGTIAATSNSTLFQSGGTEVPQILRPLNTMVGLFEVEDNGTHAIGKIWVTSAGQIVLYADITLSSFTASGDKGFIGNQTFSYIIA